MTIVTKVLACFILFIARKRNKYCIPPDPGLFYDKSICLKSPAKPYYGFAPIAQLVEQFPFKEAVSRSSRDGGTIKEFKMATNPLLIQKVKQLRARGFTLDRIAKETNLPRTTVYDHIKNVTLSPEMKWQIHQDQIRKTIARNKARKGKCWKGREIDFPEEW